MVKFINGMNQSANEGLDAGQNFINSGVQSARDALHWTSDKKNDAISTGIAIGTAAASAAFGSATAGLASTALTIAQQEIEVQKILAMK